MGGNAVATRRATFLTGALAGALALAGCSSATASGSSEPEPSATQTVSRGASWFQDRIRVCFQNMTSRNLDYYNIYDYGDGGHQRDFAYSVIKPGTPFRASAGGETIDVLVATSLRTINKIGVIPVDVRIYDAQ